MNEYCAIDPSNIGYTIALVSGFLAVMAWILWPEQKHCTCCSKVVAKSNNRRHK